VIVWISDPALERAGIPESLSHEQADLQLGQRLDGLKTHKDFINETRQNGSTYVAAEHEVLGSQLVD
jgi:hypothetical protein